MTTARNRRHTDKPLPRTIALMAASSASLEHRYLESVGDSFLTLPQILYLDITVWHYVVITSGVHIDIILESNSTSLGMKPLVSIVLRVRFSTPTVVLLLYNWVGNGFARLSLSMQHINIIYRYRCNHPVQRDIIPVIVEVIGHSICRRSCYRDSIVYINILYCIHIITIKYD